MRRVAGIDPVDGAVPGQPTFLRVQNIRGSPVSGIKRLSGDILFTAMLYQTSGTG
jgi:hypothetical protein